MSDDALEDRLTERNSSSDCPFQKNGGRYCYCGIEPPHGTLFNRDGMEALDRIESLTTQVDHYRKLCEQMAGAMEPFAAVPENIIDRWAELYRSDEGKEAYAALKAALTAYRKGEADKDTSHG